ncbi:CGNR zinc finger domain-containing protein [Leifsonia sp. 22587]|uniref:CGNR zinc finger domain-containing protein n=1 Tax=Leifsonia sp. 22587 TaxID=3453946 RepID=UPI003F863970
MGRQTDLAFQREDEMIPARLKLVRDFVNTVEYQEDEEGWEQPADLTSWLVGRGLLRDDDLLATDADLALAKALREGLRSVLATHAGHEADPAALRILDDALAELPLRLSFAADASFALEPASDGGARGALAGVLDAVRASREDGGWSRLKVCDRVTCRWAYYDYSKNRSSRWCTMAGCGNAVKMQKAHARRASSPA